jgi:hypothetical protein
MKIVPLFWIGTAICIALSGCTGLVNMPKLEGCYPLDTLSVLEQTPLHVGRGNPIFLIGGKKFVCTCYGDGSLTGAGEKGDLGRADETGALGKADENGSLSRADEKSDLGKAGETGALGKADEEESLSKADEKGGLGRADETGALGKADEEGSLSKTDEQGGLDRADEKGGLDKADERGSLDRANGRGISAAFSCRIVPECPGFQLIGYGPKEITVLTPAGQKSVPACCITW